MLTNFNTLEILSKEDLKTIKGGVIGDYTCTASCRDGSTVTCTDSQYCNAHSYTRDPLTAGYVECGLSPSATYVPCNP